MLKLNHSKLIIKTITAYQLFTTLIHPKIECQLKSKNEPMWEQHLTHTITLEKKFRVDIKFKNINKIKISLDNEGKILGYKHSSYPKKSSIENLQTRITAQNFLHSTIFGSVKLTKI